MKTYAGFLAVLVLTTVMSAATAADKPIDGLYRHAGWCSENLGRGLQDYDQWTLCKKMPVNSLRISKLESDEYAVAVEFHTFANTPSHCRFAGLFIRTGDVLELAEGYSGLACKLKIRITPDSFKLEDPDRTCRPDFCWGKSAGFEWQNFPRWNKPAQLPDEVDRK